MLFVGLERHSESVEPKGNRELLVALRNDPDSMIM